jgi:topoisomerase-4 subunit A
VKKIDELRVLKKVDGIAEVRDESDRRGLSIVIELKKAADAQGILNYLLKNTDLRISYNFNMVAIYQQRPVQVGLKTILTAYLEHQQDVITKRTRFNLNKAQARQHIVLGLIKALSILDQVIQTIRSSQNKKDAKQNLVKAYAFSEAQAEAIVSLQLYRLTNTDITALQKEQAALAQQIETYQQILADPKALAKVLRQELRRVAKAYESPRRSEIQTNIETLQVSTKVLVAEEDVMVAVSHAGYLKRSSLRSYHATESDDGLKDEDFPIFQQQLSTLNHLLMFTSHGHVIYRPIYEITDSRWKDPGEHISQTIGLAENEVILKAFAFPDLKQTGHFVFVTSDGLIKQSAFDQFLPGRTYKTRVAQAIKLKDNAAQVVDVLYVPVDQIDQRDVFLATHRGYGLRYALSEVPESGSKAAGAKAINLTAEDQVVGFVLVDPAGTEPVAVLTQRGALKCMAAQEVTKTTRGRKGMLILRELKRQPHRIQVLAAVAATPTLLVQTDQNQLITLDLTAHPLADRYSNGSFVMAVEQVGQPELAYPVIEVTPEA